jgi:hypothetical protein
MTTDRRKSRLARTFTPAFLVAVVMFAGAPFMIASAPYESTMGLVQKIFYFHVPSAMMMFVSAFVCGIASAIFLFKNRPGSDRLAAAAAELVVVFGALVLITGPLWARKSWGVWWQWDARLTSSLILWMIFVAYQILRKYGAGSGPGAVRNGERAFCVLVGERLAHRASENHGRADARSWHAGALVVVCRRVSGSLHRPARAPRPSGRSPGAARSALPGARREFLNGAAIQ